VTAKKGTNMEWKIIVFAVVCVAMLACMWRGGPCCTFWRSCKERLRKTSSGSKGGCGEESAPPPESKK